jgi:hypothetical protein
MTGFVATDIEQITKENRSHPPSLSITRISHPNRSGGGVEKT